MMFGRVGSPGSRPRRYIDTQKDTQFSDVWILLVIILTIVALVIDSSFLTAAAVLILTVVAFSWLWSWFSFSALFYSRRFSEIRAFTGENVEIMLEVHNQKPLPLTWLNIVDAFPPGLPVSDKDLHTNPTTNIAELRTFWMVGPFQKMRRRFNVECVHRGFYRYGPAQVSTGDPFGFFSRRSKLVQEDRLIIYPRIYTVSELRLPSRNPFGETRAKGRLFEDPLRTVGIREWQSADSLQRVHWKATARHQSLLSRVYEPSEEQQILIFLNVATMERHWYGHIPELQERSISVAGSLAALAAEQRLPVGLMANGALPGSDQSIRLLPGRNAAQLTRILELLAAVTNFATEPVEHMLLHEAPKAPWGATLVIVTAIAHEELLAALITLSAAGRNIVLFTLAEKPPHHVLPNVTVYHLPHLLDEMVAPNLVN